MNKQKRFLPIKNHKGISKDTFTGKYYARKTIDKKPYSRSFLKISDAIQWRNTFHPLLTNSEIKGDANLGSFRVQSRLNGVDSRFTLGEVWELYQKNHLPMLERQSVEVYSKYVRHFLPQLMGLKMQEINAEVLDGFMELKVKQARKVANPRRYSFDKELKFLKTLLNWYRENYDNMFVVPVVRRHFILGIIKKIVKKKSEKMKVENVKSFLNSFESQFWKDLAELHFYMAGRAQEPAGLQWSCVDFEQGLIKVEDVAVWSIADRKFSELKEIPKNRECRIVRLNRQMLELLKRRWHNRSKISCEFFRQSTGERLDFVFEIKGQPVSYRKMQYNYNKALKRAGLYPRFTSTHILRKAMANIVRQEMGLDAAQAAGGWKTRSLVEQVYTDAPTELSQKVVDHVGSLFEGENPTPSAPSGGKPRLQLVEST